ncbi:MAG: DeoR/GlpR family DNA-binding transcription regulator [Spirochaetales bacterium]|nr:DeoR/GlpR family DNA-binding transcription regulator [Spirochaetales bacterium]
MLAVERRHAIFGILQETGSVTVIELSRRFDVSEETIRRDLTKMESAGLLQKTYGGAFLNSGMHLEVPVTMREHTYVEGKNIIGTLSSQLIHNGDTIFLDASTTAVYIAENILDKKNLIVITNALKVAETLARGPGIKVICAGGTVRPQSLTMVGKAAETAIATYFADKAFICCDGVHRVHGVTDANEKEAEIRKQMMRQAESSILVVDATKFDKTSFVHMADFGAFDVMVTDRAVSPEWRATLEEYDVELRCGLATPDDSPTSGDS